MKQLGAQPFYYRGEADDATSLELVVEPWLEGIAGALEEIHGKVDALSKEEVEVLLKACEAASSSSTKEENQDKAEQPGKEVV
jgi:hypothetical protein